MCSCTCSSHNFVILQDPVTFATPLSFNPELHCHTARIPVRSTQCCWQISGKLHLQVVRGAETVGEDLQRLRHLRAKPSCTQRTGEHAILQSMNRQPGNRQPVNRHPVNRQPVNRQPVNRQPVNRQPVQQATGAFERSFPRELPVARFHLGGQMNTDAINASAFFASTFITARVPVRPMQCNAGFLRDLVANLAG